MKCEWPVGQDLEKHTLSNYLHLQGGFETFLNKCLQISFSFIVQCIPDKLAHILFSK